MSRAQTDQAIENPIKYEYLLGQQAHEMFKKVPWSAKQFTVSGKL